MSDEYPTHCFLDDHRLCDSCAAHSTEYNDCRLLMFAGMMLRNQKAQAEVLENAKRFQDQAQPLLNKALPVATKFFELSEKAMPMMEKLAEKGMAEIAEELGLDDDGKDEDA